MTRSIDTNAVTIEPMRREDLDEVAELDALVSNPVWSRTMFESELLTNPFATFLVARGPLDVGARAGDKFPKSAAFGLAMPPRPVPAADGATVVCGYLGCWIIFDELHVLNVAVHPDYRRRGIASRLVRVAFDRADAGGALRALLEVRASNEAAQRLYARFGFRVIARRSHYYMQPTEDALMMGCEMRDVS